MNKYTRGMDSFCSFPDCGRKLLVAGLCSSHYEMKRRGQELRPIMAPGAWRKKDYAPECSFDGCGRKSRIAGLCSTHYKQHNIGQELRPIQAIGSWAKRNGPTTCAFPECDRRRVYAEHCHGHYRQTLEGRPLAPIATSRQAFLLDALRSRNRTSGCWLDWPGTTTDGRPKIGHKGRSVRVAQLVVLLETGSWARHACHTCDDVACWNPAHLYNGDATSNAADRVNRGRARGRFSA